MALEFKWGGVSLEKAFKVGEAVTYEMSGWWGLVRSEHRTAAARGQTGFLMPNITWEQIPDGPKYMPHESCNEENGTTHYGLHVELDGETTDIGVGETGTIEPWQIVNAFNYQTHPACPTTQCDPLFGSGVFALRDLDDSADADAGIADR